MRSFHAAGLAGIAAATVAVSALAAGTVTAVASPEGFTAGTVPAANPRTGVAGDVVPGDLTVRSAAWGNLPLTNPDPAAGVTHYGYTTSGGPLTQAPGEAAKTEPDKNVYLVLGGHHYLFQGHEGGPRGYVTRIDLDEPDPARRVALVTDHDTTGAALPTIDGITWDPFTRQLLLTAEHSAPTGGVWAVGLDAAGQATGPAVHLPALGSGGYEGIQNDADGNLWIAEDIGGPSVAGGKKPFSYVYRFTPADRADLTRGGRLEALQVLRPGGAPVTAAELAADPAAAVVAQLHTPGRSFATRWVTVGDGTAGFDATASAAAAGATPFKRPENGVFRPGTGFREFYFSETGDTSTASTLPGAYGAIFRIVQDGPSAATGRIEPVVLGDAAHSGFDNIQFASRDELLVVEDAGETLHTQRDALDSGYVVDVRKKSPRLTRWLAEGRDPSADFDGVDNEITGIHVSDGDPTVGGVLGAKVPRPFDGRWRVFWTQQHGDNTTWEVSRTGGQRH